jgi:RNA polymerase sigma-70 factor (ECF subfamily)
MHDVEGYTHEEISGTLNIPIGTSKSHLFQARGKLRAALADFAPEWVS